MLLKVASLFAIDRRSTVSAVNPAQTLAYVCRVVRLPGSRFWFVVGGLAAVVLGWVGCTTPSSAQYDRELEGLVAEAVAERDRNATLGPGDVFEIRVFNESAMTGLYRVAPDGFISFPLIGRVQADGTTPGELAGRLVDLLKDGYLRNPSVTIFVKEYNSKRIFVMGQVQRPGTFPYQDNMSVIEAITLAGGFTPRASEDSTVVSRMIDGKPRRIPVPVSQISSGRSKNLPLQPGDIVFVPESIL